MDDNEKLDQVLAELESLHAKVDSVNSRLTILKDVMYSALRLITATAGTIKGEAQTALEAARELLRYRW